MLLKFGDTLLNPELIATASLGDPEIEVVKFRMIDGSLVLLNGIFARVARWWLNSPEGIEWYEDNCGQIEDVVEAYTLFADFSADAASAVVS